MAANVGIQKLVDCTKFHKEIITFLAIEQGFGWLFGFC